MILVNNRNYLRLQNRDLLNSLDGIEEQLENSQVIIEDTKKEVPTLRMNVNGKMQYVHSKYDPINEAKRLLELHKDIEVYDHVLFIGSGLGHHIKMFTEYFPDKSFSIYEENLAILYRFFSVQDLSRFPAHSVGNILSSLDKNQLKLEVKNILQTFGNNILFITLPIYEKLYQKEVKLILETFKDFLKEKRSSIATNASFQKRWTINSIKNLPTVLRTPNVLHDINIKDLEGKPAIIVAAGPSLSMEYENLKYIKEKGLAYIFSVGSAINALVKQGIYPDAICTYDPQDINYRVIRIVKEQKISTIPLIFGSSVGFETLEGYPGPMLHALISQDTIAPSILKHEKAEQISSINDAPSIAVVTFQLLCKLNMSQIILVGQNLAYYENNLYANGIQYEGTKTTFSKEEMERMDVVPDVNGNLVRTNDGFIRMRDQFELYIQAHPNIKVINTTVGGAAIKGAEFSTLSQVIKDHFQLEVINKNWYEGKSQYQLEYAIKQMNLLYKSMKECQTYISNALNEIKFIENCINKNKKMQLESRFVKFDKDFAKLKKNQFYKLVILPMIRVQSELLVERSKDLKFENDLLKRGRKVADSFGPFLEECRSHFDMILPLIEELKNDISKDEQW